MAKISCGSLIRRAGGPNILGTAGCLVQWPGKTDQLLLLTAARVLVGRTAEQFEAIEAVELPGMPIGCLYAWSSLEGPTTADVALVHVDPALVDAGIGLLGAPKGTNLDPQLGDKLTIFADGKTHDLAITDFGDRTIDRVTPDSGGSVNYLNQIICDPATEDRCVGAMAMDGNNNIVGMVVGGDGRTFTLVTPIDALLSCTFGGPAGPALEVCTSVPANAKPPEKVAHPDHATPVAQKAGAAEAVPAWVTAGLRDLGFHETGDNQGIERFITQAKVGAPGDPWSAIWANAKLEQSGIRGTRSASSQSFRHDPNFVELDGPALGAIAVYWRGSPDSGLGHVGFYMGETATQILTLGGNESDAVREQFEPKSKLRGYWWPKSVPLPKGGVITVTSVEGAPGAPSLEVGAGGAEANRLTDVALGPIDRHESRRSEFFKPDVEPVDAAVFCPPRVKTESIFLVQVYLYQPPAADEAAKEAHKADIQAERRGTYSLPLDIPHGTRVDIRLEMEDFEIAEPDAVVVWRGRITSAQFEVAVPATKLGNTIGRVRFAVAGIPAGTLRFMVEVVAQDATAKPTWREADAVRYRRAFASYSSEDRGEVLRRVQAFRIAQWSVFQDILELEPGERWERAVYREIDRCDVFLLFWSRAAAASEWVAKEIDYALNRKGDDDERPPAIQPVPIEAVPPPAALKHLHFNDALLAHIKAASAQDLSH